jgi:gliding motility-associated-like protein
LVVVEPVPTVELGADFSLCLGESQLLDAGAGLVQYSWSTPGGVAATQTVTASTPGIYGVTVTDAQGCQNQDVVLLTVFALPAVDLGPALEICIGSTALLDAGPGFASYDWSDGSQGQTVVAGDEGMFGVSVTDVQGCIGTDSVSVSLKPSIVLDLGPDTSLCQTAAYLLRSNISSNFYLWQDGSGYPELEVTRSGTYVLTVMSECGPLTDSVVVDMHDGANNLFIPTAFSPNDDGLNDVFEVGGPYTGVFQLQIFDRWGMLIYQSSDRNFRWAGERNGRPLPEGVYAYRMTTEDCAGKRFDHAGTLTLLR